MKTLFLTHPVVMTRRQGNHSQRIELAEFTFARRGPDDPQNDENLIRACLSAFHDEEGHPVTERELNASNWKTASSVAPARFSGIFRHERQPETALHA